MVISYKKAIASRKFPESYIASSGDFSGITTWFKYGQNLTVNASGTEEIIWSASTVYTFPTAAATLNIVSDNANDSAVGTGARTVLVIGLDANYDIASETITMNGVANVSTINSYIRVNRVRVVTAGSNGTNLGNITATGATVLAHIPVGAGITLQCIFTIPNGVTGYLEKWRSGIKGTSASVSADIHLHKIPFGEAEYMLDVMSLVSSGKGSDCFDYGNGQRIEAKTDLLLEAHTDNNNMSIVGGMQIKLLDN